MKLKQHLKLIRKEPGDYYTPDYIYHVYRYRSGRWVVNYKNKLVRHVSTLQLSRQCIIGHMALREIEQSTKHLTVDLDLLAEQANHVGLLINDFGKYTDMEVNLLQGILDMLCDIEMYLRQDGQILLKEKE